MNDSVPTTKSVVELVNGLLAKMIEAGVETKPVPQYSKCMQVPYGGGLSLYFLTDDVSKEELEQKISELDLFWHAKELYRKFENRAHVAVLDTKSNFLRMVYGNDREYI